MLYEVITHIFAVPICQQLIQPQKRPYTQPHSDHMLLIKSVTRHLAILSMAMTLSFSETLAQEFTNGELTGVVSTISVVPMGWQAVPIFDPNSLANCVNCCTPDLTSTNGPATGFGVNGNAYSGQTFVSGLYYTAGPGGPPQIWHEGIQQTVSGFTPGNTYPINFSQAVVKQWNAWDSSGSWAVYADTMLIGIV